MGPHYKVDPGLRRDPFRLPFFWLLRLPLPLRRVGAVALLFCGCGGAVPDAPVLWSGGKGYSVGQPARGASTPPAQQPSRAGSQMEAVAAESASCGEVCPSHHGWCSVDDAQKRAPCDEMPYTKHVCPSTVGMLRGSWNPPRNACAAAAASAAADAEADAAAAAAAAAAADAVSAAAAGG